jgi:replicative DNA helicase
MQDLTTNNNFNTLKTPPHSVEAEQMLIACVLLDESSLTDVLSIVNEANFYRKEHQIIFQHIIKLKTQKRNVDAVTLAVSLEQDKQLEFIGGHEYINSLVEATNNTANIVSYAEIIREYYVLRELIKAGNDITELGFNSLNEKDVGILLDEAEQKIFSIKNANTLNRQFADIKELLNNVIEKIMSMSQREDKNAVTGIATHYYDLDSYTSGLQRGELIIIAGRPGMGKTSFALNIAENVAIKNKMSIVVFSLEMTGEQLVQRLISSNAQVDQSSIKRGDLTNEEMDNIYLAINDLREAPVYIAESSGINVIDLRARSRRLKEQVGDLGLIVIDYVQIMSAIREGRNSNRAQELADISRSLKSLALELNVPIILLSQLNRDVENRQDKRPNISDLRESGALEQDADIILLLYRDEYYNPDSKDKGMAEINIAKNRSGSTGIIKLAFIGKYTKFQNPYFEHNN